MAVATVQIRRQTNKPGHCARARNRGNCSSVSGIRRPTAAKRPADGLCGQSMQANHARNWFKHRLPNLFARGAPCRRQRFCCARSGAAGAVGHRIGTYQTQWPRESPAHSGPLPGLQPCGGFRLSPARGFFLALSSGLNLLSLQPSRVKTQALAARKSRFFAPDLIASKPLKPCDGGVFRGLQFAPVFAAKRSGAARPAFQYPALPPGLRRANKPAVRAPWLAKRSRRARLGSTRRGRQISTRSPSCRGASGAQGRPQMP